VIKGENMIRKKMLLVISIATMILGLQGCAVVALGTGAAVTAKTALDPRTIGTQVDDTTLSSRVGLAIKDHRAQFAGARIVGSAYNGNVLLTGQAQNKTQILTAERLVNQVDGVIKVYDQIRIAPRVGGATLTNDALITANVKSQLIANKQTKARNIKVVTENSEVFLMGIVTPEEAKNATEIASKVAGVKLVVTAFEYIK
jgi:osmotically-inducible protein OsmY